jgi:tRNA dimethylallyltransferase
LNFSTNAILIAGPTASGKSALALRVAQRHGGVVINADSMQIYADLRILSARPGAAEQQGIEHLLYGVVDGAREYNVGDYLRDVAAAIAQVRAAGRLPVLVGGTGLYFRAMTEGLVETPDIPAAVTDEVTTRHAAGDNLHRWLASLDPESAARLAPADIPRVQRALEVYLATGLSVLRWRESHAGVPLLPPGSWQGVFLAPPLATLYPRIDARFEAMMAAGALDEVRALMRRGLPANRGIMKAHGVPHLVRHLNGELTSAAAIALGQQDTRNYAKRQLTWARKFFVDWAWAERAEDVETGLNAGR